MLSSSYLTCAARAVATLLALFSPGAARRGFAAESEGRFAPVVRPAEGDSITVSKKEFDAAKSSRDPALQPKGDVPRLSTPEMSTGVSGFSLPSTKSADPKEKKSANWLLDAMEKSSAADRNKRSSRGLADDERERERDTLDNPLGRSSGDVPKDGPNSARESNADAKQGSDSKTIPVANPLDRYLAGWMSPGDYALLKPTLTESANGGRAGSKDSLFLPQVSGSTGLPGANAISGLVPGAPIAMAPPPPPKTNPYLEILNAPASAPIPAVTYTPPSVVTPAPKVPVFAAPPPLVAPPQSKIPDFVKPAQDEKYYKQLKRF